MYISFSLVWFFSIKKKKSFWVDSPILYPNIIYPEGKIQNKYVVCQNKIMRATWTRRTRAIGWSRGTSNNKIMGVAERYLSKRLNKKNEAIGRVRGWTRGME
jgi:hypothetical protein